MESYLQSAIKQFKYYKMLGDKSISQLPEEQIHWTPGEESNSIAVIVKHLRGNMLSRWTDFLSSDGEKIWRNRDDEFTDDILDKENLIKIWQEGWKCLFHALDKVTENDLETIVYIRNQGHTVVEAINRQLAHYSYHVGQIVYLARMIVGENWQTLTIGKGKSQEYNNEKFLQERGLRHFTDEFLDE